MKQIRVPLASMIFMMIVPLTSLDAAHKSATLQEVGQTVVRGRIYAPDDKQPPHLFSFESVDGKSYRFLPNDVMTAMFADRRVRDRELQITARLHPGSRLEVIKVQAARGGKLYDLYYFCEVCNITAYAPGPCPCCREEMEFRETPTPEP
jgi:rubrerythrin